MRKSLRRKRQIALYEEMRAAILDSSMHCGIIPKVILVKWRRKRPRSIISAGICHELDYMQFIGELANAPGYDGLNLPFDPNLFKEIVLPFQCLHHGMETRYGGIYPYYEFIIDPTLTAMLEIA